MTDYKQLCIAFRVEHDIRWIANRKVIHDLMKRAYIANEIREIRSTLLPDAARMPSIPFTTSKIVRDATSALNKGGGDYIKDSIKAIIPNNLYSWHATRFIVQVVMNGINNKEVWTADEDTYELCIKAARLLRWMIDQIKRNTKDRTGRPWIETINSL